MGRKDDATSVYSVEGENLPIVSCWAAAMTIGKSEDDYGDADDCFDVNESGGRDSDRRTLLRYFHLKVGTFPRRSTSIQIRRGDMPGCHIKGERGERASGPIYRAGLK